MHSDWSRDMRAMFYGTETAMNAARYHSEYMPGSMPAMWMCAFAASATDILIRTDVVTSVSLFVLVRLVVPFLLTILVVVLISLLLIGLTRLVRHESLVGLKRELATGNAWGD